jgi:NDP-sugar pyrophosphorylase family protein
VENNHDVAEDTRPSSFPLGSAPAGGLLPFVEIFGTSLLEHTIAQLANADVEIITLLVHTDAFPQIPTLRTSFPNISIQTADEVWAAVAMTLKEYAENGIQYAFIAKPNAYTEADLMDLLDFHRQRHRVMCRASDHEGALDVWVVSCGAAWQASVAALGGAGDIVPANTAEYFAKEYTRRLNHLGDLRQLVTDAFLARCRIRPAGQQIRPGVWAEEGVGIGRGARIVAPAYLGRGCEIRENTLVTRFSNIESFSYIDYGTAIEDTTILPNTYVGIWLDVRHAVVNGNKLMSVKRNVMIEISDPSLIRSNVPHRHDMRGRSSVMSLA